MERQREFEIKVERLRKLTARLGGDAFLAAGQADFAWLTAGGENRVSSARETGEARLLVTPRKVFLVANSIEMPRLLAEEVGGLEIEALEIPWHREKEALAETLAGLCPGSVILSDSPGEGRPADAGPAHFPLLEPEIERYRTLGRETARALTETALAAVPGQSEIEIAAGLAGRLLARNIFPAVTLVAADERTALFRHPLPTGRKFERRLMLVAGARRAGLVVSATRMVAIGPPPADLAARHRAVTGIDEALIRGTRPGRPIGDIFRELVAAYERAGYPGEWLRHHQGGPTGYRGRYYKATPDSGEAVPAGSAFAWNPSIAGTKSEDTIIVSGEGPAEIVSRDERWPLLPGNGPGAGGRPDIMAR